MDAFARRFVTSCALVLFAVSMARAATFTVTNLGDAATGGTLRWAITAVNTSPAPPHVIAFNVPAPFRIAPTGALPAVTGTGHLINGASQPGYVGTPIVQLSGTGIFAAVDGLDLTGTNITVRALHVIGWPDFRAGIRSRGRGNRVIACTLERNFYGVEIGNPAATNIVGGSAASNRNLIVNNRQAGVIAGSSSGGHALQGNLILSNGLYGVDWRSPNSLIGGTIPAERNIISANTNGIYLNQNTANGVQIIGNFIGVDATGTNPLPNLLDGVQILAATNCIIGGFSEAERNIISGNGRYGVWMIGSRNNQLVGNYIGVGTNGTALGNGALDPNGRGVLVESGTGNVILNNAISGNIGYGIAIISTNAVGTAVLGNFIGTTPSGFAAISNQLSGVFISQAVSNIIGSSVLPSYRNIISGNGEHGIVVSGTNAGPTVIANNFIGSAINGTTPLSNGRGGILVTNTRNVQIGSVAEGPPGGNLISGNAFAGITIGHPATENIAIQHNFIGSEIAGTGLLVNTGSGIDIVSANTNIWIGVLGRNLISGNQQNGVRIRSVQRTTVANNLIGVATNGTAALRNVQSGILITGQVASVAITNNTISGNLLHGIQVMGRFSSNIVIAGNRVGANSAGTGPVSNLFSGVFLQDPGSVLIGGIVGSDRNIISGNGEDGVAIIFSTNADVSVIGNSIGVNAAGSSAIPNGRHGVFVSFCQAPDDNRNVVIGGALPAWGNYISGNRSNGVYVNGSRLVAINNNRIGIDPAGGAFMSNHAAGVVLDFSSMTNEIINNHIANNGGPGIALLNQTRDTYIAGNTIGVGNTPFSIRGNNGPGIYIQDSARSLIGGDWGDGNRIGYNNGPGIAITSVWFSSFRSQHEIYGNRIYGNVGLPIDLLMDGVTTNDPAPDADFGWPNELQNFPVLNVVRRGPSIWLYSTFVSQPLQTYRVEYFASSPIDGMSFIGWTNVVLPPSGTGVFAHSFVPLSPIATGAVVWATASTTNFGTSEFSAGLSLLENLTDSDNDKMPDWWEILYLFNPAVSNAPGANADGDEYADLDEWIAFTDPRDSQSFPRITAIAESTANRLVTFPSSDERVYRLARTTDPATNPVWSAVSGLVTGQFGSTTLPDTNAPNAHAYRMEVRLP